VQCIIVDAWKVGYQLHAGKYILLAPMADQLIHASAEVLRSFALPLLSTAYSNYRDRCFASAGPKLWNSLPAELRQADISFQRFKLLLKTFLFGC